jgi:galactose mutarotase-like enzyme
MSASSMDRREFIKHSTSASLALGLTGCKATVPGETGGKKSQNPYRVELDDKRGIDFLVNETGGSRVMIKRLGCEVSGYRITDPASGKEIPLLYRDGELEPPESGWGGHATVMFPIVGGLKNDRSRLGSKTIILGGHGFARLSMFEPADTCRDGCARIRYRLIPPDKIKEAYPFDFHLDLIYEIAGNSLSLTFDVGNPGAEPISYCLGWHPGFKMPVYHGQGSKSGCRLVMPSGVITKFHHNEYCRLTGETSVVHTDKPLEWTEEELFGTLLYGVDNPDLRSIKLEDPEAGISIKVDFQDFANLGLWSEPGREYICIEPSQGMDDHEEQETFDKKIGVVRLEPGRQDIRTVRINPETG